MNGGLLALALPVLFAVFPGLDDKSAALGRQIYREGVGEGRRTIPATVGDAVLTAAQLPCASCHGVDGLGRPEGGVVPSALLWARLTAARGHTHPAGRSHPAFHDGNFGEALVRGVDPAGNELDLAMPRFALRPGEVRALAAYLRVLADEPVEGLTDETLWLGVLLPPGDAGERLRALVESVLVDHRIYGRRLQPRFAPATEAGVASLVSAGIFAAVGGVLGPDAALRIEQLSAAGVPLVAPFLATPLSRPPPGTGTFHVLPGVLTHLRIALLDAAVAGASTVDLALGEWPLAAAELEQLTGEAVALGLELRARPWPEVDGRADAVIAALTGPELEALLPRLDAGPAPPRLYVSGSITPGATVAMAAARGPLTTVTYPILPSDQRDDARARLLNRTHGRPELPALFMLVALDLMDEGLARAGRSVRRDSLVHALETLQRHETGLTRTLTFGPNRHVGLSGVWLVPGGPDGFRAARWLELE